MDWARGIRARISGAGEVAEGRVALSTAGQEAGATVGGRRYSWRLAVLPGGWRYCLEALGLEA